MPNNPPRSVTVPELVAMWREQAALYRQMPPLAVPPSASDVAEMCARGLELLFADRAVSPRPAEPPAEAIRRRSRPFREYLLESLRSLPAAVAYLIAAKEDSPQMLVKAVDDVIAANAPASSGVAPQEENDE